MISSMTGFGRGDHSDGSRQFSVEIKSVNHRYNDIIVRMPKHLSALEEPVKKIVKQKIRRGRVEVYINFEHVEEVGAKVKVDTALAKSYKEALTSLNETLNLDSSPSIDLISKFPDVLRIEKEQDDEDELWACLKIALEQGIDELYHMRLEEGAKLANDIKKRMVLIDHLIKEIDIRAPEVVLEYKEKLQNRIKEILPDQVEVDENKLASEVAYFSDKSNVTEEVVRIHSHLNQLINNLDSREPVGRKLDFLVQEINREVNTIGSKVGDVTITNKVVEMKSEIEKIREQVQNIE